MPNDSKAPVMPYSPLDALINALSDVRKAGKVKPGDDVLSVQQRIADVFRPIVKRIQAESRSAAIEEAAQIAEDAADKDGDEDSYDRSGDKLRLCAAAIRSLKGKNHA